LKVVTNLNDSGVGSLREALTSARSDRYTIVVFRTGGTIALNSGLPIDAACVYLAGQSAPGGGIQLRQNSSKSVLAPQGGQVAIRYLRLRHAGNAQPGKGASVLQFIHNNNNSASNSIVDHVSVYWTLDEGISFWRGVFDGNEPPLENVTVQRSIMTEGLYPHSTGGSFGGHAPANGHEKVWRLSWHHNLFSTNGQRNPAGTSSSAQATPDRGAEIINNVVYNWGNRTYDGDKNNVVDLVNNYWKQGPMTPLRVEYLARHARHPKGQPGSPYPDPSIYISGNVSEKLAVSDQWEMIRDWWSLGNTLPPRFRRLSPLPQPPAPVSLQSASAAYTSVVADVGANARLDCQGQWVGALDGVDQRIIDEVRTDTGAPTLKTAAGPFPVLAQGTPCADGDGDGMPDQWEVSNGLDPNNANDAWGDRDGDGYWNIEEYLNGTSP
jgi:hypothetical protein